MQYEIKLEEKEKEEKKKDRKKEFDNDKEDKFLPYKNKIIKVPSRIGHNYIPIEILSIEELCTKYSKHKRLKVFSHKGLNCVNCSREGKYLISGKDINGYIHVDLYTKDFILMTIDHIKPKSKGGSYNIENLNPMCTHCNSRKSNIWEDESILKLELKR